jgi:hypothetical protein
MKLVIRSGRALLAKALKALDQEAMASENWKRKSPRKCPAWYRLRAEIRDALK